MLRPRRVIVIVVMLCCAACSQDNASTAPPPTTSSPTRSPTHSSPTVPPELVGYSEIERAEYTTAVGEYDAFIRRNDAFYAAGATTLKAKRFYQRYSADWSTAWGNLAQVANSGVRVRGRTTTVWTKPTEIDVGTSGGAIVLRRCLDESRRVVTQNGRELAQPQLKQPHVYTVRLVKRSGEDYWRSGVAKQGATC